MCRYLLRSHQDLHGAATSTRRRIQDGSIGLLILLRSSLRIDESLRRIGHGSPANPNVGDLCCWFGNFPSERRSGIPVERLSCVLGKSFHDRFSALILTSLL